MLRSLYALALLPDTAGLKAHYYVREVAASAGLKGPRHIVVNCLRRDGCRVQNYAFHE